MMKKTFIAGLFGICTLTAHGEYKRIKMSVFGMDCPPCAYAIRASMRGIQGVNQVTVDLNTGLVTMNLNPGNNADMRQFYDAVEKNGFLHKDSDLLVQGIITGSAKAPFLDVIGTKDRYALAPLGSGIDLSGLMGKPVLVEGVLPQSAKDKVSDTVKYKTIVGAN